MQVCVHQDEIQLSVSAREGLSTPFSHLSPVPHTTKKPYTGSAHHAVQTCPQAGATHANTNSNTHNNFSKVTNTQRARNLKQISLHFKNLKASKSQMKPEKCCSHRNVCLSELQTFSSTGDGRHIMSQCLCETLPTFLCD